MNKPAPKRPFQRRQTTDTGQRTDLKERAWSAVQALLKDRAVSGYYSKVKQPYLHWDTERDAVRKHLFRTKDDYLAQVALDNPQSVVQALLDAGSMGLSLQTTLKHAYLTPETIGGRCSVVCTVSYLGFESLALRTGKVLQIQTELVYANDTIRRGMERDGRNYVEFQMASGDRGPIVGGFCRAQLDNGSMHVEWMDIGEIDGCEDAAKAMRKGNTPPAWAGPFRPEMQKKCIVRRAAKHWILTDSMVKALEVMDKNEPMDFTKVDEPALPAVEPLTEADMKDIVASIAEVPEPKAINWIRLQIEAWGYAEFELFPRTRKGEVIEALQARLQKIKAAQEEKMRSVVKGVAHG